MRELTTLRVGLNFNRLRAKERERETEEQTENEGEEVKGWRVTEVRHQNESASVFKCCYMINVS